MGRAYLAVGWVEDGCSRIAERREVRRIIVVHVAVRNLLPE